ncbi:MULTISPECIES: GSCFA domain-containing protein [unclassified Sphingobium]|uniref:GSCFA domain-containing protein n=1 Tax=unclassified Sphingobium TaxID=2611147 RepID=UPI00222478E8|nr:MULTISPECIES: GSCFA domain-containing protein [unclassified Sphingobium]MCW2413578.1 hypothetical protein [Sphingobium sp. B8D3D]MCW2414121.1 hypothetical protein [Sphingobium sp. B8D3A]
MGKFTTCESRASFSFSRDDLIFTIGSCFARNIERKLSSLGFRLPTMELEIPPEERISSYPNEILNKYTTAAIVNEMRWILGLETFPENALIALGDNLYSDPHIHPGLPPVSFERAIARRAQIHALGSVLPSCRVIILTLGLVETWFDAEMGLYLNGAPPRGILGEKPDRFSLHRQSYKDVLEDLEEIHAILKAHGHPEFKMILSVSPVPFKATYSGQDAIAANMYSKSVLRAAAEEFCQNHSNVDYFPSYEMVVLSDRDHVFNDDRIHVTDEAVGRIMELAAYRYVEGYKLEEGDTSHWKHRDSPFLLYKSAIAEISKRNYDNAVELLKYLDDAGLTAKAKVAPAEFYLVYGTTLAKAGHAGLAEPYLARAAALLPDQADPQYKLGLITARLRRREAISHLERAVLLNPESTEFLHRLGVQYERERQPDLAIATFHKVLAIDPAHEGAQIALLRVRAS